MEAITAKQKAEEKYVSLCFAILAEFLSLGTSPDTLEEGVGVMSESAPVKSEPCEADVVESKAVTVKSETTVTNSPSLEDLPDYYTPELAELLSDSCLLPAMASYLLNDSGKHFSLSPPVLCTYTYVRTPLYVALV